MRLYLMRHATAGSGDAMTRPADEDLPLTPNGMSKARAAAHGLAELRVEVGYLLTSPLSRAVQTAEIAAHVLGIPGSQIRSTKALQPGSDPALLLDEIGRLEAEKVLCIGHSPHLDDVISKLLGATGRITALKKAGIACLQLESVAPARALLLWLFPQKVLRHLGR
jgi:phosphohistidine phosphatase